MEMLGFFFDQFKIPIIGILVLVSFVYIRLYWIPVRAEKVEESGISDTDEAKEKANIAE